MPASASPCRPPASAMSMSATASRSRQALPMAAPCPHGSASMPQPAPSPARRLNGDVGALAIRVTATDTAGASASQDFTVTVANVNDAPVASVQIANQATNEDAGFSFTVPPASFSDVDVGDSLTLSASLADGSALPAWLSFDATTSTFSGTPLERRCRRPCHPRHRHRYRRRQRFPGFHRHGRQCQ